MTLQRRMLTFLLYICWGIIPFISTVLSGNSAYILEFVSINFDVDNTHKYKSTMIWFTTDLNWRGNRLWLMSGTFGLYVKTCDIMLPTIFKFWSIPVDRFPECTQISHITRTPRLRDYLSRLDKWITQFICQVFGCLCVLSWIILCFFVIY